MSDSQNVVISWMDEIIHRTTFLSLNKMSGSTSVRLVTPGRFAIKFQIGKSDLEDLTLYDKIWNHPRRRRFQQPFWKSCEKHT